MSELRGGPVKILRGRPAGATAAAGAPGAILGRGDGGMLIACGEGTAFALERVQLPGKKPVSALDFMNGARLQAGERFAAARPAGAEGR